MDSRNKWYSAYHAVRKLNRPYQKDSIIATYAWGTKTPKEVSVKDRELILACREAENWVDYQKALNY